jgi:PIN domain nuclease of toxin-antitoxin system
MNLLLDTHILLWYLQDNNRLSQKYIDAIENTTNRKFVSIASLWEISIKISLGKLSILQSIDTFLPNEISILPIEINHLIHLQNLPLHHRDPFDRIIISQAIVENMQLLSDDANFPLYEIHLL